MQHEYTLIKNGLAIAAVMVILLALLFAWLSPGIALLATFVPGLAVALGLMVHLKLSGWQMPSPLVLTLGTAVVALLAFAVVAWLKPTPFQVPPGARSGQMSLAPCDVRLGGTRFTGQCGHVFVAENPERPNSSLLALPVTRILSTSADPSEPVYYLEGGPGMSNMRPEIPLSVLERHDVVMVGYRGVDGSVRLDCPEVAAAMRRSGTPLLADASLDNMGRAISACYRRLAGDGLDPSQYTIDRVIGDIDAARTAFGDARINLFSRSYGTRIALIYAARHPATIRRSMLVGANPPGRFVWSPEMIDKQIGAYSELRQSEPGAPDLTAIMRDVSQHMPPRWLGLRIDPGKVKTVSFALLFHRRTAALVFDAWEAAARGDASGLALLSAAHDLVMPRMFVYGDFLLKALSADFGQVRDYRSNLNPEDTIIGSPLSLLFMGGAQTCPHACQPAGTAAQSTQGIASPVETLIVSGNLDLSTPAEYATREILPHLPNARQIVLTDMGHVNDLSGVQPAAFARLAQGFFNDGRIENAGFSHQPMDLSVRVGLPAIAKAVVVILAALLISLVVGLAVLLRRKGWMK